MRAQAEVAGARRADTPPLESQLRQSASVQSTAVLK